jgi:hypothetical protein
VHAALETLAAADYVADGSAADRAADTAVTGDAGVALGSARSTDVCGRLPGSSGVKAGVGGGINADSFLAFPRLALLRLLLAFVLGHSKLPIAGKMRPVAGALDFGNGTEDALHRTINGPKLDMGNLDGATPPDAGLGQQRRRNGQQLTDAQSRLTHLVVRSGITAGKLLSKPPTTFAQTKPFRVVKYQPT